MDTNQKLEHAKQILLTLKSEIDSFLSSRPYRVGNMRDDDTRLIYIATHVEEVPKSIPLLTGDIIQNLRSALDHIAYALYKLNSTGTGRHVYFPISENEARYNEQKERWTDGMSQEVKDLFDTVRPYGGGNDILWHIHALNNIDKHRNLITSGAALAGVDIGAHMMGNMAELSGSMPQDFPELHLFLRPTDNVFPLSVGSELFIDGPGAEPNPKMGFAFNIVMNEPSLIEGVEILSALASMGGEVERQVKLFQPLLSTPIT